MRGSAERDDGDDGARGSERLVTATGRAQKIIMGAAKAVSCLAYVFVRGMREGVGDSLFWGEAFRLRRTNEKRRVRGRARTAAMLRSPSKDDDDERLEACLEASALSISERTSERESIVVAGESV